MHKMEELKDMLVDELDEVTAKGKLTAGDLDTVDKLTHSIKSIDTILAMDGYSNDYRYDGGMSYARKRDSLGRYSRENRNGYSRGYSYGKESMIQELRELMNDAETEKEREAIGRCIDEMNVH